VKVGGETVLVGAMVQDITARKRADEALVRSEQRFRRVVEARPVGILFADMAGQITDANDALLELLGYERAELTGTTWASLTPPEYAEADAQATAQLFATGSVAPYAKEYLRKDGSRVPVLVGATMLQTDAAAGGFEAVGFVIDTTARTAAETALRISEQRFRALADAGILGVIFADENSRILEANQAFLNLLGLSARDLEAGVTWRDLTPPEWADLDRERDQYLKRHGAVPAYEKEFLRKDGSRVAVLVGAALTGADGRTGVGFVLDITERRLAEERLRRLQRVTERLAEAQSLAEVRQVMMVELRRALDADGIGLRRVVDEKLVWEELAPGQGVSEEIVRRFARVPLDAAHPAAEVARSGAPLFTPNPDVFVGRYPQLADALAGSGVMAHAHLPLRRGEAVVGVLSLSFTTSRVWDEAEQAFALAMADRAAAAYERAQLLAELHRSEARYRSLVEATTQVVWRAAPDGQVIEPQQRWSMLTGIPTAALPDELLDLVHPADREAGSQAWHQAVGRIEALSFEQRVRGADGQYRTWQVRAAPVLEESGRVREWVGTDTDITARVRVEQALQESEARLSALLEQLPLGVGVCDLHGRWILRNPLFGRYVSDQLSFSDPAERRRWRSWNPDGTLLEPTQWAGARALRGELVHPGIDFLHTLEDGSELWTRVSAAPFRNLAGEIVGAICMVQDIDERKRAEVREAKLHATVAASEQQLRLITDGMPALIAYVDRERRYQFVNKTYTEWFNLPREAVIGRVMWEILGEAAYDLVKPEIDRALEGQEVRYERLLPYRRGGARYVQATYIPDRARDGTVNGFFVLVVDLTERKQVEDRLRYQTRLLEALTESILDGILVVSPEGQILQFNQQFIDIWRFPPEVVASQSDEQALAWAAGQTTDPAAFLARVSEVYGQPEQQVREELTMRDGRIYERFGAPIRDGDARLGWLWTFRDITERKQAERERERLLSHEQELRREAEEASRLKDEFLATVSHELRTPLTAFLGYAQMLQSRKRDETYIARTVEKMVRSAKAQAQLIEDLLDISRIVSGRLRLEPTLAELRTVVRAALDTVRPAAEAKQLTLLAEFDPAATRVVGDVNRLQQVVWNLLSNAVKFTPSGGAIMVQLAPDGGEALLSVSDTGQGISPAFLPYVFDRFRQADGATNRSTGGLGLGLAIVRHLVELHGGTVQVASDGEGRGATFSVRLPLAIGNAFPATASSAVGPDNAGEECPPELAGLRVLVVDDQPQILALLEEILTTCGAVVQACGSAHEALETVRSWRPDVLVSDIAMPGEDGYWLIEQVRALSPDRGGAVPAVALTAYVRMEDRLRVLAAGFEQYLPKPVEPTELRAIVASVARSAGSD
jgi:PAS domain S-box-containing protein